MQLYSVVLTLLKLLIADTVRNVTAKRTSGVSDGLRGSPVYEGQCDPPFTAVPGGHCYFPSYNHLLTDWNGAQLICSWLHPGGKLAEFETQEELLEATLFLNFDNSTHPWAPQGPWIGAIEVGDSNEFVWHSSNAPVDFNSWSDSETGSSTSGDGVALDALSSFDWIDVDNQTKLPILCEIEANPPPVVLRCPQWFSRLGDGCYRIFDGTYLKWNDAQAFCRTLAPESHLAELETAEELFLVMTHVATNHACGNYWIGAEELGNHHLYQWASSGKPVAHYYWEDGQPNNLEPDNVILVRCVDDWKWGDAPRNEMRNLICEAKLITE
ncbi:unnamed protein product [Cyprideis torosa]|uniref:Uncharacterized protein n=1 Tax=Cyprideis torosa TaxID=163714 RepID=A0A7R8WLS0_9CRUS|nr:unnamed protein product [Cyprideis torosa]CAG0898413.1 unnamed protein product [Cyprideis torosa]